MEIGLLWRAEWDDAGVPIEETCKLRGVFAAFAELGVRARPVVYSDSRAEEVRALVLELDGLLVWVNPIQSGLDRSRLDPILAEAVDAGVFVSARPDVILRMGTKEVLVDTAAMEWGSDTHIYRTFAEFRSRFPARLSAGDGALVLKQRRGMGGNGVWKVAADAVGGLMVQHAAGAAPPEHVTLDDFVRQCEPYFSDSGLIVEQPYQTRLPEGMIRAYLTHDRVVGFTHQYPRALMPPGADHRPSGKVFELPTEPSHRRLRDTLERAWVPEMQRILGLDTHDLPVIWDADFLYGPKDASGADTFVLCEINVSSTFAFPEFAMPTVAQATMERVSALKWS